MRHVLRKAMFACAGVGWLIAQIAAAQDWPQWRGPNRDARATGFHAPESWPRQLRQTWKVNVGNGVATPAVVGDKVFVFTREDNNEVIRCLTAATGEEVWQDRYEAEAPRGGASNYPGPRSSPAVANGKVVTLGVQGTLSCYNAQTGELVWRKDEFDSNVPMFYVASSPIIVEGMVVAQLGGREAGGIIAFDLASGEERWRWEEDSPAYGSPVLATIDNKQVILAPTNENLVALGLDGNPVWQIPYAQGGRYNTATPIVAGDTIIIGGPGSGLTGLRIARQGNELTEQRAWRNDENSLQFNTPVLKDDLLFGLTSAGQLFCVNTRSGETAWSVPLVPQAQQQRREGGNVRNAPAQQVPAKLVQFVQQEDRDRPPARDGRRFDRDGRRGEGRGRFGEGRGRGGRGGGRGRSGYGSVVDAGTVLIALSPAGQLVVFEPDGDEYEEVARYQVADEGSTYAYPVAVGKSIYIKDREALTKWSVE